MKQARQIVKHAQSNEITPAAFDAAFLTHWQSVCRVLVRLVGDPSEAEDLALEAFWRLYRHAPSKECEFNVGGWLYRVATNLGLNALRARKRRALHELEAGRWQIETQVSDPMQAAADEEERVRVRAVLAEMDERQAQLLLLRHSGMAYAELADALQVAPTSIGTLLARAEREFEKRYRQRGDR
jgi:RNA polymerase sigma-70 factor, ECF subfamily